MSRTEFVLATAIILFVAFCMGWFANWLLNRFTRVAADDVAQLDRMSQELHEAEETRDQAITYLQQREAELTNQLAQTEAELRAAMDSRVVITNTGDRLIVTLPQDILFATDSTNVSPALRDDLAALAQNVNVYQNSTLQVVGHTDSDGEAAYNQQLSERRAQAVGNILLSNGVPQQRLQTFGRGESQPVASNLSAAGKAQNRRVEIVILPNAR